MKRLSIVSTLAVCAAAIGLHAAPACANPTDTVMVGGVSYEVTYVTGSFNALATTLEAEPFWNNASLATSIATAVGAGLGDPNEVGAFGLGPLFAFGFAGIAVNAETYIFGLGVNNEYEPEPATNAYAEIVPQTAPPTTGVPEPMSAAAFGTGLGLLGLIRRRRS